MSKDYFLVIRGGVNSTFQDLGRENLYHLGIPFSGAMDTRNFLIANKLAGNQTSDAVIEFAFQGPCLKYFGNKRNIVVTGDVSFKVIKEGDIKIPVKNYETIEIDNGDVVDIINTNNSVYGYLSTNGGFEINKVWGSFSTSTRASVGPNMGKKLDNNQKIFLNKSEKFSNRLLNYSNTKIEFIRVIEGTNFNYFSKVSTKNFFSKEYLVTKFSDRMGMRLEGVRLKNIKNTNIKSEGLVKGTIQVPGDGNPIILLSDHGTIGGYPKLGVVISADYDKLVQIPPGSKIKFKNVKLKDAEILYKLYNIQTNNILNKIL